MSRPRQYLTSIQDKHQMVVLTCEGGISGVIAMPGHPYYRHAMRGIMASGRNRFEVHYRTLLRAPAMRVFKELEAAEIFATTIMRAPVMEQANGASILLLDVVEADKAWRAEDELLPVQVAGSA